MTPRSPRRPEVRERGSGTVIAVAVIGGILAVGLLLAAAVGELAKETHVQGVADISAIAAASTRSCAAAGAVLTRQAASGLVLTRCEFDGGQVQVEVVRSGVWHHSAIARAGPTW